MSAELSSKISDLLAREHQLRKELQSIQSSIQSSTDSIVCRRYAIYAQVTAEYVYLNVSEYNQRFIYRFFQKEKWRKIVDEITSKEYSGPINFGELLYYRDTRRQLCLTVLESFYTQQDMLFLPYFDEKCAIFFDTKSLTVSLREKP